MAAQLPLAFSTWMKIPTRSRTILITVGMTVNEFFHKGRLDAASRRDRGAGRGRGTGVYDRSACTSRRRRIDAWRQSVWRHCRFAHLSMTRLYVQRTCTPNFYQFGRRGALFRNFSEALCLTSVFSFQIRTWTKSTAGANWPTGSWRNVSAHCIVWNNRLWMFSVIYRSVMDFVWKR